LIYAATEAPMMQWFVDVSCRTDDARIPIGYPLPGNRLALIDEYGRNTPPGEVGELIVGSPYVTLGLWVDGRCAADSIESNGAPSCRLFRTGDLVRQRPDGLLERIGRKDRQVKIRAPASISKGWKPPFASTPWCATSASWRGLRSKRTAPREAQAR